MLERKRLEC